MKIAWYVAADGRTFIDARKYGRKLIAMRDHAAAVAEALRIAVEINAGGVEAVALTAADRAVFARATADAMQRGRDLLGAMTEWSQALDAIAAELPAPRPALAEVVRAGVAALHRRVHPTEEVATAFLLSKAAHEYDGRHRKDIETIVAKFADAHPGDFAAITTAQIETWLHARTGVGGAPLSGKRFNHVRAIVVALFKFARARKILPDVLTAAQGVEPRKVGRSPIHFLTPAEMMVVLEHVEEDWLPWPLLVGFGALRVEEVALGKHAAARKDCLRWDDFDWQEREIVVREDVAKIGAPRRIPIHENLWSWLQPWRDGKATGPVVPRGDVRGQLDNYRARFQTAMRARATTDEIPPRVLQLPDNAFRHSYGSYRMAQTKNVQLVSNEMGDSPSMIKKHYDNPRPKSQASAWWAIYPESVIRGSQLILPFPRQRAS